jgi:NAD dependent epimerase/dehydratase family enzyme
MKTFAKILAKVLRKPLWFKIPGWLLKMIMGDMAKEAILKGQKVIPKKLQEKEFDFKYPGLEGALKNLVSKD